MGSEVMTMGEAGAMAVPGGRRSTISVVIPSYRRPEVLTGCLRALTLQSRAADEVVVVLRGDDSQSIAAAQELEPALPGLRIAYIGQPGLLAAINRGLDCAAGDFVVLTDDDSEAFPDWLERVEAAFLSDARIGAVGGRDWLQLPKEPHLFNPPEVKKIGQLQWNGVLRGSHHCPLRGHTQKVMFLKGVNFAIRSAALGGYRIDRHLRGAGAQWGTELDLCMHIRNKGFDVIFDDRILVKHFASPRPAADDRQDPSRVHPAIRFNRHYLVAKHFSRSQSLLHLGSDLLVGRRLAPGLLACIKWTLQGDAGVWRRLAEQSADALAGYRAGRRARLEAMPGGSA